MSKQLSWHIEGQQQPFDQAGFVRVLALLVEHRHRERLRADQLENAPDPLLDDDASGEAEPDAR
jgi:hypothetical protein